MTPSRDERNALADALLAVGPDAPTLCEGWTTHDLAAHLWCREHDVVSLPGVGVPAFAGLTDARLAAAKKRWPYDELVERFRAGAPRWSPFSAQRIDQVANLIEYFVHTEDVLRANAGTRRPYSPDFQDVVWQRLRPMAKVLSRGVRCGLVFERADTGQSLRAKGGASTVTVLGTPTELALWAFGRRSVADVRLIGADADLDGLSC